MVRNQCITDFFQPAPKQDHAVLCSPGKKNEKVGLPVSRANHPRRNVYSPKRNRRKKFPLPPPDRSPIMDAFFKGAKMEKKGNSNDGGASITMRATYPKVVVRKLFISESSPDSSFRDDVCLRDLEKSEKCPLPTRTPLVENSRECKMEYMDLDIISSGLNKWASASENDILRKESHISWCQKAGCFKTLQSSPASASHPSSLETPDSSKQVKKEKRTLFKQQTSGSVKKSLATNVSQQDAMDSLRKRSCSASWESSTDDSSTLQASKVALSSGQFLHETIRKSQSCPSVCAVSRTSSEISKHKEHPGKRKKISLNNDLKISQKLVGHSLDTHNFSGLPGKHNSENEKYRRSFSGGVELEDRNPSDDVLPLSMEYLDLCEENGNCDQLDCIINKNDHIRTSDASESQAVPFNSYLEELLPLCQEQKGVFDFPSISCNSFSKVEAEKTPKDISSTVSSSIDCNDVTIPPPPRGLNEMNSDDSNLELRVLNRKSWNLSDSEDDNYDCGLDSSDDEILLSFEEILAQSAKPTKNPEPTNDDDGTQDITVSIMTSLSGVSELLLPSSTFLLQLSKLPIETQVSYVSRLEHLLKEKEEFRRVDELEKQLQEVKQQVERESPSKELSDDGELTAEHRAFIERFLVIDAIPDQHPGENIFQMAHAGKIFSQHNLDLRNAGFCPRNPIEKYLVGSGITQQLFVINEGLLMPAYHSSLCPVPILKWMFQAVTIIIMLQFG
uniref:Uncharacterized protein n=1 Tax=Sphaerodactylus townsendi TaxID=933632 RepID=A0ACB8FA05_9SAUR